VPGLPPVLDARLRRIRRRGERRRAQEEAVHEAERAAARARDGIRLRELGSKGGLRVNVGCGPGTLEDWVNVDIEHRQDDVLLMDAARPWPLPDSCADAINSEHFIEHISREDAWTYLSEAARVLRSGGVLRTSTPSLRGIVDAYLAADPELMVAYSDHPATRETRNHSDMLNNFFYKWDHRHIYDIETLSAMLEEVGFESIEETNFGNSRHPLLQGIDIHDEGVALRGLVFAVDAVRR
jgi:predicted SAM-dependent methyltransferase